jgi:phosphatidylglycerol:prolipoprotein diacylglycerol transferase
MSVPGGFLGTTWATILFARLRKIPVWSLIDVIAPSVTFGLFLGRLANFVNGELFGRYSDAPWAFVFPYGGPEPRHPSQLYEAGLEGLLLGAVMWGLALKAGWLKRPGALIGVFFLGYGLARSFVENFRQWDEQIGYVVEIGSGGLTMGQMLSLPMVAIGLGFLWHAWRKQAA